MQHNSFKNRIISLIENPEADNDSKIFKMYLGELHHQLERNHIHNRGDRVTFTNIVVEDNPQIVEERTYRRFSYKVEIEVGNRKRVISTIFDGNSISRLNLIQNNGYDWDEVINDTQYRVLPAECQRILKVCYELSP